MYKVMELLGHQHGRGDVYIHPEEFKTAKEAVKLMVKVLTEQQRQLNSDSVALGEPKWYWKKETHDLACRLPWWTDGYNDMLVIQVPKYKAKGRLR